MKRGIALISNNKRHDSVSPSFSQSKRSKRDNSRNLSEELLLECSRQDAQLDRVKSLVQAGAYLEVRDNKGFTPLLQAVNNNHLEIVKYLIKNQANLNAKSDSNITALHLATERCNIKILSLLIRSHIDLEPPSYNGKSLLITLFLAENAPEFFLTHFINEVAFYRGLKDPEIHNNYLKLLSYGALYTQEENAFKKFKEIVRDPRQFCNLQTHQQIKEISDLFNTDAFADFNQFLLLLIQRAHFVNKSVKQEIQIIREINEFIIFGHCFHFKNRFDYQISKLGVNYHISYEGHRVVQTAPYLAQSLDQFNEFVQNGIQSNRIEYIPTYAEKFTLNLACQIFSQFADNVSEKNYLKQAALFQKSKIHIFTYKWKEHVAGGILFYNKFYFINKGFGSLPGIYCFDIDQNGLPQSLLELASFLKNLNEHINSDNRTDSIFDSPEILRLNPVLNSVLKLKPQTGGHCSYVSFKHTIEALFMMVKDNFDGLAKLYGVDMTQNNLTSEDFSIDAKKLYKAFKKFNDYYTIDRFIEINRDSSNIHKWEPLSKLLSKLRGSTRNRTLIKYVANKLLEEKLRALEEKEPTLSSFEKETVGNPSFTPQLDSSLNADLDKTLSITQSGCSERNNRVKLDYIL